MALLRNGSALNQYPLRQLGGGVAADISMANRSDRRNIYSGITDNKSGIPNGHGSPSAWLLPLKPGGMSSVNYTFATVSATAAGTMGAPVEASALLSFLADATGGLITSGEGVASLSLLLADALLTASLSGDGAASMLLSGSALLGAQANITATAQAAMTAALQAYAVGHMAGDTVDDSVLTAQAIAQAVGDRIIEAGLSADDVARLLLAFAAGNATGLEGADPKFYAQDGTTVRIDGSYIGGNRTIDSINGG